MLPPDLDGHGPAQAQSSQVSSEVTAARLNGYLQVLASGSKTSMVFKYVVPSKPPTAMSCPFTTARPTCRSGHSAVKKLPVARETYTGFWVNLYGLTFWSLVWFT